MSKYKKPVNDGAVKNRSGMIVKMPRERYDRQKKALAADGWAIVPEPRLFEEPKATEPETAKESKKEKAPGGALGSGTQIGDLPSESN